MKKQLTCVCSGCVQGSSVTMRMVTLVDLSIECICIQSTHHDVLLFIRGRDAALASETDEEFTTSHEVVARYNTYGSDAVQ
jgi:hypothetical protein